MGIIEEEKRHTRLPLEQVFRLESGNVRNGSEDISAVGSGSFDTVSAGQLCSILTLRIDVVWSIKTPWDVDEGKKGVRGWKKGKEKKE